MSTNPSGDVPVRRIDRILAFMSLGLLVLSILAFFAIMIASASGADMSTGVWPIVGVLVFTQFLEPVARTAASLVEGLSDLTQFLPGAASDTLVGASIFSLGMPVGDGLQWWGGGLVLLGYAVVLLVLGYLVSWRRDVS